MSTPNTRNLSFGIGGLLVADLNNNVIGRAVLTGALTANISGELLPVVGGGASLPVEAVKGRSDGALTLTLNERPEWIDIIVNDMVKTAISSHSYGLTNVSGTTLADDIDVELKSGGSVTPKLGAYMFRATGTDSLEVTLVNGDGSTVYTVTALGTQAKDIGTDTNLTVKLSAAGSIDADGVGTSAVLFLSYGGTEAASYALPVNQQTHYVRLITYTPKRGPGHSVRGHDFAKVALTGSPVMLTDNESLTTEITGIVLEPGGGVAAYRRFELT